MKPENKQFLEDNRPLWITLRDAQYLRFPHQGIKDGLVRVMREEFRPGYTADLWCPTCVATMVREVYTEFEKWEVVQDTIGIVTIPTIELSDAEKEALDKKAIELEKKVDSGQIQVKANFPSHKQNHRRK